MIKIPISLVLNNLELLKDLKNITFKEALVTFFIEHLAGQEMKQYFRITIRATYVYFVIMNHELKKRIDKLYFLQVK